MAKLTWHEQYRHPNWQRKRLESLNNANWECENCGTKEVTLNVHHKRYIKGRMVWEYGLEELSVLCEPCHEEAHEDKELLLRVLGDAGIASHMQAAGLLAGYLNSHAGIDPGLAEMVRQGRELYYELGVAAGCLEAFGVEAWRNVIREHVRKHPSVTAVTGLVEMWDEKR